MTTIFLKELRQHGILAVGVMGICLLLQIAFVVGAQLFNDYNYTFTADDGVFFLGTAVWLTLLYAGVAAALVYSTEHADNTFSFLRRLPISPLAIALGKAGWVLCGTALVLIVNLAFAAAWMAFLAKLAIWDTPSAAWEGLWTSAGIGIVEVLVWGLFWTTRCRAQYRALLATFLSTGAAIWIIAYFHDFNEAGNTGFIPQRLTVCTVVGLLAVWGMFRWFHYDVTHYRIAWLFQKVVLVRYPQTVQPPFFALIHQHIRHASVLYSFGILCFAAWSLSCLVFCVVDFNTFIRSVGDFVFGCFYIGRWVCVAGMFFFWGTIFGHDQKDDSYRVLQRIGIPDGTIWWSRMLLPMLLYLPVLLCFSAFVLVMELEWGEGWGEDLFDWYRLVYGGSMFVTVWLAPVAVGAFISISLRRQVLSICFTIAGTIAISYLMAFLIAIGTSPLWTALPICIALLVASRIRTYYWLRETFTWRSRLLPLLPLFGVLLAIMAAYPFVRIYSVPYVSWSQIEAYLDQADIPERMPPEKRSELIQHIADTPTFFPAATDGAWFNNLGRNVDGSGSVDTKYTYDEYLLRYYAQCRYEWTDLTYLARRNDYAIPRLLHTMPWESARRDRALRLMIVNSLLATDRLQDKRAESFKKWSEQSWNFSSLLDWEMRGQLRYNTSLEARLCQDRLTLVANAIQNWHAEHKTLPESLDVLVGTYLTELPVQPFTNKPMEYHINAPPPKGITYEDVLALDQGYNYRRSERYRFLTSGGTYLRLGRIVYLIILPEIPESSSTDSTDNPN